MLAPVVLYGRRCFRANWNGVEITTGPEDQRLWLNFRGYMNVPDLRDELDIHVAEPDMGVDTDMRGWTDDPALVAAYLAWLRSTMSRADWAALVAELGPPATG